MNKLGWRNIFIFLFHYLSYFLKHSRLHAYLIYLLKDDIYGYLNSALLFHSYDCMLKGVCKNKLIKFFGNKVLIAKSNNHREKNIITFKQHSRSVTRKCKLE